MDPQWTLLIPSLIDDRQWLNHDSTKFFDTAEDAEAFIEEYRGETAAEKFTVLRVQNEER